MISFTKNKSAGGNDCRFSIVIPTWNNLKYLELCVNSIIKNSAYEHQIIIAVNEGVDGTKKWVENHGFDHIYASSNIGICYALNACRSLVRTKFIMYANDDMYFLPDWDVPILEKINELTDYQSDIHKYYMISSTLVEPSGDNPCAVIRDFGADIETFREDDLLKEKDSLRRNDWRGSMWPPNVMPLDCWDLIGGMSVEFHPGMYSDPDICRKMWEAGVRDFIGVGNSLVYHFGCKSTKRVRKNRGRKTFIQKWGITPRTFTERYLLRGRDMSEVADENDLPGPSDFGQIVKRILSCFGNK